MALGLSALSLVSCEKDTWLNPQLTTAISDATAFDTRDRIAQQVNSLYASVKSGLATSDLATSGFTMSTNSIYAEGGAR